MFERSGNPTIEEFFATLKHSASPTIVVEGKDDTTFYQDIERQLGSELDFLPVGGRTVLLELFKRRHNIKIPVVFVADRDMWVFGRRPNGLGDLVLTKGFSIENDMFDENRFLKELTPSGKEYFTKMKAPLSEWFAYQVEQKRKTGECCLRCSINELVDADYHLVPSVANFKFTPSKRLVSFIEKNCWVKFRGKTLLDICFRARCMGRSGPRQTKDQFIKELSNSPASPRKRKLLSRIAERYEEEKKRCKWGAHVRQTTAVNV